MSDISGKYLESAADLPWKPKHPGHFVKVDIREPYRLSQGGLAKILGVTRRTINELEVGRRELSDSMARRLSELTGQSYDYWWQLQFQYNKWLSYQKVESYGIQQLPDLTAA